MEMIAASKSSQDSQKLPPTERAAQFPWFTFQVMLWRDNDFDPEAWGWKLDGTVLKPVMTIRLQHQKTSLSLYGVNAIHVGQTHDYTCRKNGMKHVAACEDCRGEGCKNAEDIIIEGKKNT